jgi:hypothetical protein
MVLTPKIGLHIFFVVAAKFGSDYPQASEIVQGSGGFYGRENVRKSAVRPGRAPAKRELPDCEANSHPSLRWQFCGDTLEGQVDVSDRRRDRLSVTEG